MKFIENYRNRKCKTWIGKFFQTLVFTHVAKLILFGGLVLFGAVGIGVIESNSIIFALCFKIGLVGLAAYAVIFMVYAWFINPIREYLKNKK